MVGGGRGDVWDEGVIGHEILCLDFIREPQIIGVNMRIYAMEISMYVFVCCLSEKRSLLECGFPRFM